MEIKNKKHKLKNYNLIIFCSLSLCLLYYTNRTNVDIRKKLKNASTTIETLSLEELNSFIKKHDEITALSFSVVTKRAKP